MAKLTPMMQQYMDIKNMHKDCILFFRLGDFYEMFFEDALIASKILEITLTGRDCGLDEKAPMCGIPFHAAEAYISRMVSSGHKVAICEQTEAPGKGNTIVNREVVKIITASTLLDSNVFDEKSNNYLASIYIKRNDISMSFTDISTDTIYSVDFINKNLYFNVIDLLNELSKIKPSEIISNKDIYTLLSNYDLNKGSNITENITLLAKPFTIDESLSIIKNHFEIIALEALGFSNSDEIKIASIANLLDYLYNTQKESLINLINISVYKTKDFLSIDNNTRRNLELIEPIRGTNKKHTLFAVLDNTKTAMGARKLKKWILEPLQDIEKINNRLDFIEQLFKKNNLSNNIKNNLKNVYDIERLAHKIMYGNCNARDINSLKTSIKTLPEIKRNLSNINCDLAVSILSNFDVLSDIYELINFAIKEDLPTTITEGNLINDGYNEELDKIRDLANNGKSWLEEYLLKEKERINISNLKIGYNKIFGYYIEITKSHFNKIPENYIRKQTLSSGERFITPELKEMESKILNAQNLIGKMEYEIFSKIKDFIKTQISRIQKTADMIACVDSLNSLFTIALNNNYIRPKINQSGDINISDGRHPIIEQFLTDEKYIPNSTFLNKSNDRFSIITGPNMSGKSTYMRQVALIALLAHIGSFVPADSADICILDKIFSRVGASDDLSQGQSTFMVEMNEVSSIISNATENSLIILDEIGRGTSTYDGLSIAWAVTEHIANKIRAKTLFATHYHEMSELEGKIEGINNYRILVKETSDEIIFLRKISRGNIDRSYGIYVAKLAGIPNEVIMRANSILNKLEETDLNKKDFKTDVISEINNQIVFDLNHNKHKDFIIENILNVDINTLTPIEALNYLSKLHNGAKEIT